MTTTTEVPPMQHSFVDVHGKKIFVAETGPRANVKRDAAVQKGLTGELGRSPTIPELAEATRRVLDASGVEFDWQVMNAGEAVMASEGTPLPQSVLDSILRNKVALKGPITTPVGVGFRSVNVALRQTLGLYANLRPVRSIPGSSFTCSGPDASTARNWPRNSTTHPA